MATALNIGWSEVDEMLWSDFLMVMTKLEEIRSREESALKSTVNSARS